MPPWRRKQQYTSTTKTTVRGVLQRFPLHLFENALQYTMFWKMIMIHPPRAHRPALYRASDHDMAEFYALPGHGFFDKLSARAEDIQSLLCVGLDPHTAELGEGNCNAAGCKAFCLRLVEATKDVAVAYKPNAAFFEAFGVSEIVGRPLVYVCLACVSSFDKKNVFSLSCYVCSRKAVCARFDSTSTYTRMICYTRPEQQARACFSPVEFIFRERAGLDALRVMIVTSGG